MKKRAKPEGRPPKILNREFFANARKKAWAKLSAAERKEAASKAGSSYWSRLSPEERSAEMKRRAKVRAKNRTAKKRPR